MSLEKYIRERKVEFDDQQIPPGSDVAFKALLKEELHQSKSSSKIKRLSIYTSVAASLVLMFALGYSYRTSLNERIQKRDELVLALDEDSASDRLEAVYEIEDKYQEEEDPLMLNALYKVLLEDTSGNVKIATIDFLLTFPNNQDMRLQLVKALEKEKEPLVQHKLIESLTLLRETRAKQPLQKIIDDKEVLPSVRGSASASLAMLNQ